MTAPGSGDAASALDSIRQLIVNGVIAEGGPLDPTDGDLMPDEMPYIARAIPARRREFRAGRIYARRALSRLGISAQPILPGADRAPMWPAGTVGSISHTRHVCVAVAALQHQFKSVGIDVEHLDSLMDAYETIHDLIATPSELAHAYDVKTSFSLIYTIKEAFYKLYYPLTGVVLEHLDVNAAIFPEGGRFIVRMVNQTKPVIGPPEGISGRFALQGGTAIAYAHLRGTTRTSAEGRQKSARDRSISPTPT